MRITTIEARIRDRGVSPMPQTRDRPLSTDSGPIGLICRSSRSVPRSIPGNPVATAPRPPATPSCAPSRATTSPSPPARDLHNTTTDHRRRGVAELPAIITRYTATFMLSAAIAALTRIRTTLRRRPSADYLHDLTFAAPGADRGRPRMPHMRGMTRLGSRAPNVRSCMLGRPARGGLRRGAV